MNKVKFKITIFLWLQTSSTSNLFQKGGLRLKKINNSTWKIQLGK